jgi:putative ABC transport system permease protein
LPHPSLVVSEEQAVADIERETGLRAYLNRGFGDSDKDFNTTTVWWYVKNTGIPISFGITVIVGFVVGMAISCQTFYTFVMEHMKHLGALKAMGASNWTLCMMLVTQAFTVGLVGYGIGLFLTGGFAHAALQNKQPPFYMPMVVPFAVLGVILFICAVSASDRHLARGSAWSPPWCSAVNSFSTDSCPIFPFARTRLRAQAGRYGFAGLPVASATAARGFRS